jgi:lipopolysaccharide export system protein LptC
VLTLKNSLISLLLILSICLSSWSIMKTKRLHKTIVSDAIDQPDAIMEGVVATIINKEGSPALKIETPKMTHFVKNDTTDISTPHITVYRDSPEPWHIHSDSAQATQGVNQIVFRDHVTINHNNDTANPKTLIKTTVLTVFPNKKTAETHDPIMLVQPDTVIHAVGMLADLNDGTVKLLSSTRGEYVPG